LLDAKKITGAIVVVHPDKKMVYQRLIHEYKHRKQTIFTEGGASRRESVYKGLLALPETATIAVIHDAARPLITSAVVDEAILRIESGAHGVVVGVPIYDTVKQTVAPDNRAITGTLDRRVLWRAQTPQVFHKDLIIKAHQTIPADAPITDDAQLVELSRLAEIQMLPGDERNIKITTLADFNMAEALLKGDR
jgi:2-C-methyl-D-erythritol 4-phosphate cytidylyltransferase